MSIDAYEPRADVRADAADLPYDDNTVDEIVTWHMVEHLAPEHLDRALQEWRRVLIGGGRLEIRCPNIEHYLRAWLAGDDALRFGEGLSWLAGSPNKGDGHLNRNFFTPSQLRRVVERAGFIVERCEAHPTRSGHRSDGDCLCIAHKPEAP